MHGVAAVSPETHDWCAVFYAHGLRAGGAGGAPAERGGGVSAMVRARLCGGWCGRGCLEACGGAGCGACFAAGCPGGVGGGDRGAGGGSGGRRHGDGARRPQAPAESAPHRHRRAGEAPALWRCVAPAPGRAGVRAGGGGALPQARPLRPLAVQAEGGRPRRQLRPADGGDGLALQGLRQGSGPVRLHRLRAGRAGGPLPPPRPVGRPAAPGAVGVPAGEVFGGEGSGVAAEAFVLQDFFDLPRLGDA